MGSESSSFLKTLDEEAWTLVSSDCIMCACE